MGVKTEAAILHVDMDSFFVSVELLDKPELLNKAVAVAHDGPRSVVTSASYEARRFGVRSAMPVSRAKELCPELILIPPNMGSYKQASAEIMRVFESITPFCEQLSIDEAFLDVSGAKKLLGEPLEIARVIRARLREDLGLPASVGIAVNKFVAKLASGKAKPDGVLLIRAENTVDFLHSLPVTDMWGVGRVTTELLRKRAIRTIYDLSCEPLESLEKIVGRASAKKLSELAQGIDERAVTREVKEKSIGHENTFEKNLLTQKDIEKELLRASWRTATRLRSSGQVARTVAIKIRFSNFETVTRSQTLAEATDSSEKFYAVARQLYDSINEQGRPVRLIGVRAEQLLEADQAQATLWSENEKYRAVDEAVDQVQERFGKSQIKPASLI